MYSLSPARTFLIPDYAIDIFVPIKQVNVTADIVQDDHIVLSKHYFFDSASSLSTTAMPTLLDVKIVRRLIKIIYVRIFQVSDRNRSLLQLLGRLEISR